MSSARFSGFSLSLVALALAAPVLYHYGPSFVKTHEDKVLTFRATDPNAAAKADLRNLEAVKKETTERTPARAAAASEKPKRATKMPKKSAQAPVTDRWSGQEIPSAPALKPAAKDHYAAAAVTNATSAPNQAKSQERKFMGKDRNFSDPMKDRWVNEVSGARASVAFEKFRHRDHCQSDNSCEKVTVPRDLNVAGVVVDSDRLRRPANGVFDGVVRQGHFVNNTPAVYLK